MQLRRSECILVIGIASLLLIAFLSLGFYSATVREGKKGDGDANANVMRYTLGQFKQDKRGWLLNPLTASAQAGLSGGATSCKAVHVGQIKPRGVRGNHRHRTCNETFLIWGAKTVFRLENPAMEKGYAEFLVEEEEVLVATSPSGRAHALANVDWSRSTYFLGCQDALLNSTSPGTDFNVWKDL
eukprot:Gb_03281 [translate_table: standard]